MISKLHIPVSHGRLEALLEEPESPPQRAVVVCHPHPLFGGTMHNNVVYRMARALARQSFAVLRFNFRGVGTSSGVHGDGVTEQEDVRAALDFLADKNPDVPLWLAGFSFGARVGLDVGVADDRVASLLGVGLVPRMFDFSFLIASHKPKAFIHGEEDELGPLAEVRPLIDRMVEPKNLIVVPGAKHLFPGKLDEVEKAVDDSIAFLQKS
jgi:uncharacterized protein